MTPTTLHNPAPVSPVAVEAEDLRCPLCEYDLRGLLDPRCPECGYTFTWEEIRDPTRRLHPYLFEHHPERNGWSFVRTLLGGLRPRLFWQHLTPQQPARPRRLLLYSLLVLACALPALLTAWVLIGVQTHAMNRSTRPVYVKKYLAPGAEKELARFEADMLRMFGTPTIAQYFERNLPLFPSRRFFHSVANQMFPRFILAAAIMAALWPWLTVLGMRMMLWISMRRARVRPIHLARCALHAADVIAWYFLALGIAMALLTAEALAGGLSAAIPTQGTLGQRVLFAAAWGLLLALLVTCYRLTVACRLYLRLPHAAVVVTLTQVVILIGLAVATQFLVSMIE